MHTGVLEQEKSIHEIGFYFELCENSSSYLWIGDWVCRKIKTRQFVLPIFQPFDTQNGILRKVPPEVPGRTHTEATR